MENVYSALMQALQLTIVVAGAPLLTGWVRTLKCWMQGRRTAGLLQPYRDLARLFSKDIVLAENASWIFRFAPYVVFGATLMAGAVIPLISFDLPLGATADIIALVALFATARFFLALAAMDTGTAFGGMGSSREMTVASLAEPAMLMSIFTVSLASQSTSLSQMAHVITSTPLVLRPSLAFALLAFILIAVAETGRVPVDNPATHLELTMIHEAMILEYSGRHLALIEWAGMMKLLLFSSIGIACFFPWGISGHGDPLMLPPAFVILAAKLALIGIFIVLVETGLAKMRLFRVPEFLGSAFLLATLGMLSFFILE
ncbi:MAG: NADH-quinone oxidoreductase subunit H [Deltaproteobacteria bacterium]|nr:NADH-quinone oxidoreductase subunit H [Deltaproteobacteria bacterium]MCL4874724.1 NADH-quinone oxidoreductase subunit H [bacterium]